ncbi:hypothetical protein D9M68_706430 [compost metagenome]
MQGAVDGHQQLAAEVAVADAVIGRQTGIYHRSWQHLPIHHPWFGQHTPEADDGDLRRVDDTPHAFGTPVAQAGDGDGRVGEFGAAQPASPRPLHQIAQSGHELGQGLLVGVVDGRRHQATATQRNRPADVDAVAGAELPTLVKAVELRHLAQSEGRGLEQQHGAEQPVLRLAVAVPPIEPDLGR